MNRKDKEWRQDREAEERWAAVRQAEDADFVLATLKPSGREPRRDDRAA